ncbi:glycosyltransferase family 9 protein [Stutzerimonas chloritidismutans]|uniref:glycosyltransferase family 9 protein n=1 Tax=Stutzerimonas chloritidismutans TaxID=203192 RepID=UPI003F18D217
MSRVHPQGSCSVESFAGRQVAIVPCPALGDVTLYIRLAWIFCSNGAQVTLFSSLAQSTQPHFPWMDIRTSDAVDLIDLASAFDLVISYVGWLNRVSAGDKAIASRNVAIVSAKKLPKTLGLSPQNTEVCGQVYPDASRPFCLDSRTGKNMAQWVDDYAKSAFGLGCDRQVEVKVARERGGSRSVSIFPTTPEPRKNYSLRGFVWLGQRLRSRGWEVDFLCLPAEKEKIATHVTSFPVRSFPTVGELLNHLASRQAVISNDSGGGHLASLIGLPTVTITRRNKAFVWRPGFDPRNEVIAPLVSVKIAGRYCWRPFVPIWRIPKVLDRFERQY